MTSGKTYCLAEHGDAVLNKALPLWKTAQERLRAYLGGKDTEALMRISAKLQKWEQ